MDQNLIDYVKKCREQNISDEEIKTALLGAGWAEDDINEGLGSIKNADILTPSVSANANNRIAPAFQIFKEAWTIYKKRPFLFIGIMILPIIIVSLVVVLLMLGGFAGLALIMGGFTIWKVIIFGVLGIILAIAVFVIQFWGQTSLIVAIKDNAEGIGFRESYKRGWRKTGIYLSVIVPSGLIVFGGMALFLIPGIIFAIWLSFTVYVALDENLKGMKAILKSKEYVRGYWWSVLWRQIFIGLIISIFYYIVSFIAKQTNSLIIATIVNLALMLIAGPLTAIYGFIVYKKVKELKGRNVLESKKSTGTIISLIAFLGILLIIAMMIFGGTKFRNISSNFFGNNSLQPNYQSINNISGLTTIFNKNLDGLSPKESYLIIKSEFEKVNTFDDYMAYLNNYGDPAIVAEMEQKQGELEDMSDIIKQGLVSMAKMMSIKVEDITNIQETINGKNAILEITTTNLNQKGTVKMIKDGNQWKLGEESWQVDENFLNNKQDNNQDNLSEDSGETRDVQRISDVRRVALALEMYRGDKNSYPVVSGCTASNWSNLSTILKNDGYMSSLLTDPLNSGKYVYMYASNGESCVVRAVLESDNMGLKNDADGNILGCDCNDPVYCVSSEQQY